jgi:hypothetical protein
MFHLPFHLNVQTIIFTSSAPNSMGGIVARPPYPSPQPSTRTWFHSAHSLTALIEKEGVEKNATLKKSCGTKKAKF